MYGVKKGSDFIFLHLDMCLSQHHLFRILFFSLFELSWHRLRSVGYKYEGFFLDSSFHSIDLCTTLTWLLQPFFFFFFFHIFESLAYLYEF